MPKQNNQVVEKFDITVRTVRAQPGEQGGVEFIETGGFNCSNQRDAFNVADRLQREFDNDGDPCRTYVYKGGDPAPIYAGLAGFFYDRKKDTNRKGGGFQRLN